MCGMPLAVVADADGVTAADVVVVGVAADRSQAQGESANTASSSQARLITSLNVGVTV